eukprot:TRINITY_DN1409_c0_g1_i1.p1 TRINITY_DN1409_c0_g1~~TRINITY_DN1409_c0_g1_i1.p1  ORF type:complete len:374 (+),score=81.64 TRINITY_DN1409_c0_g1_i1:82-1203(+)
MQHRCRRCDCICCSTCSAWRLPVLQSEVCTGGDVRTCKRCFVAATQQNAQPLPKIFVPDNELPSNSGRVGEVHFTTADVALCFAGTKEYLQERERVKRDATLMNTEFFVHSAMLLRHVSPELAKQAAGTLLELGMNDPQIIRSAAAIFEALHITRAAATLYERLLNLKGEEPQTYLDLARVLVKLHRRCGIDDTRPLQRALALLADVLRLPWDIRFHQVELFAVMLANDVIHELEKHGLAASVQHQIPLHYANVHVEADLRIVLSWTSDSENVELRVTEPTQETCTPFHNHSRLGGVLSKDFTGGYGPVEYILAKAPTGVFFVCARWVAAAAKAPVVAVCHVYTNWGRDSMAECTHVVLLRDEQVTEIGRVAM